MSENYIGFYGTAEPYIPATLSEIYDLLACLLFEAPTFIDELGVFADQNIDTRFAQLTGGFDMVRKKVGEERYAQLMDLAGQAKALFADDQDDTNGKTDRGRTLLLEIENVIQSVRSKRVEAKEKDGDGEVSGD